MYATLTEDLDGIALLSKVLSRLPRRFLKVGDFDIMGLSFVNETYILGVMEIVSSVHEGFYNAPKLYGSAVRKPGKVTDFTSGLREAGKVNLHFLSYNFKYYTNLAIITGSILRLLRRHYWII